MTSQEDDYMNIVVPEVDDNDYKPVVPKLKISDAKFGYIAVGIALLAMGLMLIAQPLGVSPKIWAYFPFLWILVAGVGTWGLFSDSRKSLDVFAIIGAVIFGVPTIILSIQLLTSI